MRPGISIDDLNKGERAIVDMMRQDAWQNIATNLGVEEKDHRMRSRYVQGRLIPQAEYEAMYVEDPIFAKVVDGIPEHGTRKWIKVTAQQSEGEDGSDDVESDFGADVLDALEDLDAQQQFFELWRLARLDGGAAMLIGADDGQSPDKPLDPNKIRVVSHLNVVSRFEIFPVDPIEDITSRHFREPEFYIFTGNSGVSSSQVKSVAGSTPSTGKLRGEQLQNLGGVRIHHSRVIRMRGITIADALDRQAGEMGSGYWGTPMVQRVYDDLRQYNTIFGYVEAGFKDLSQGIMGIKNLPEILATAQGNELLLKRMTLIALAASSFNMVLFDPDHESYEKRPGTMNGIDSILIRFMEKLAAASEMPLTKLFGMAPSGLSTDDLSAEKTFNASIANKQRRLLRTPLNRVIEAVISSREGPTDGNVPEKWKVSFIPLDEPNESEQATTDKTLAETDTVHLANGVLSEMEVRSRLKNDPNQPYTLSAEMDEALEETEAPMNQAEAEAEALKLGMVPTPPGQPPVPPGQPPVPPVVPPVEEDDEPPEDVEEEEEEEEEEPNG